MAHARLNVEITLVFVFQATLQGAGMQSQTLCHVLNTQLKQTGFAADALFQLKGHALAAGFFVQSLFGQLLCLLMENRKGPLQGKIQHTPLNNQGVVRLVEPHGYGKECFEQACAT